MTPQTESKVPMTKTLEKLLHPDLFRRHPILTGRLQPPGKGEKIYSLTAGEIKRIRERRRSVVDLHPGMGGIAPDKLIRMIEKGVLLTSLDYMITRGCNFECTWCFANSSPKERDFLPFDTLQSLTREAANLGVSLFVLTGGEPLVYKDPALGKFQGVGDHFFRIVKMIRDIYDKKGMEAKILVFDDVALINPQIAELFAEYRVGLCTKGDTLIPELQDYKVNQAGAFEKMQKGYKNLIKAGYGKEADLRVVVNSVLDHTTFDGMVDLHMWVMENGFDHSIVPVHYCGKASEADQEAGIHSPHVKVLYDLLARIDKKYFGIDWKPWSAFTYDKTCNRNRSGLHVRADGDITACSESPGTHETDRYTFGNALTPGFTLSGLVKSRRLAEYRKEFLMSDGTYVCSPRVCDLNANNLCLGGCATRSAYSRMNPETGLIEKNDNPHSYSEKREDPLCPAWTMLAVQQGVLKEGLLETIHNRLIKESSRIDAKDFPYE